LARSSTARCQTVTAAQRATEPVSPASIAGSYRIVARNSAYLAYMGLATLSYAGLFAWISAASFVLQDIYGLSPIVFGLVFAVGSVGYGVGSTLSARLTRNFVSMGFSDLAASPWQSVASPWSA
jgi:hypothetical protein